MSTKNREEWLIQAVDIIRDGLLAPRKFKLSETRVSIGLPFARDQRETKHQVFTKTKDGIPQIYISPTVDSASIALQHLYTACASISRPEVYPPNALPAGDTLTGILGEIAQALGEYPQSAVMLPDLKKQDTRMLKISCKSCGYICRATYRWIKKGLPSCYCGAGVMTVERSE